jgi:hypothetical protein
MTGPLKPRPTFLTSRFAPSVSARDTIAAGGTLPQYDPPAPKVIWTGSSGLTYETQLYPLGAEFYRNPGVYIPCRQTSEGRWIALYVGQTSDFKRRLTDDLRVHHHYLDFILHGVTHVCAIRVDGGLSERLLYETDLRRSLRPVCNRQ